MAKKDIDSEITADNFKRNPVHVTSLLLRETTKRERTHNSLVQLSRSLIVSVIALIFDFGSLVIMKEHLGINYLVASVIGFLIGVSINYYLSVKWVFVNRKVTSGSIELGIFLIICVIGLVLNVALIALYVEVINLDYRIAKMIATVVVFFWNFLARKKILY